MRYRPRLANGAVAPLTWPIAMYRIINHICWPLEDGVSKCTVYLEQFLIALGFLVFLQHSDADMRYLRWNYHDVDEMLTGLPTYLLLVEMQIRIFHLAVQKERFKRLLQQFYAQIYIERKHEPKLYRQIYWQLLPTHIYAIMWLLTLCSFLLIPVQDVLYDRKDMLHKTIYLFDFTPNRVFYPLLTLNIWAAFIMTTCMFGENCVMAEMLLHLNGRYVQLRRDAQQVGLEMLRRGDAATMASECNRIVVELVRRNVALNKFAEELEAQFTFRIFVNFTFSTFSLCALCFKAYTNPTSNFQYIFWFCAKTVDLLVFGTIGSILYKTTYELSTMYYESNWEQIIYHSSNTAENVRLMKLIVLAIAINSKQFCLTGKKYFRVILPTIVKILRGAVSYFTFLISLRHSSDAES